MGKPQEPTPSSREDPSDNRWCNGLVSNASIRVWRFSGIWSLDLVISLQFFPLFKPGRVT